MFAGQVFGEPSDISKKDVFPLETQEKLELLMREADQLVDSAIFYDRAKEKLDQALQLSVAQNDLVSQVKIYNYRGLSELSVGNYEMATDNFYTSLKLANSIGDSALIAKVNHNLGMVFDELEEYDQAIAHYHISSEFDEQRKDTLGMIRSYINLSISHQNKAMLNEAQQYCDKAYALVMLKPDTVLLVATLNNMGTLAYDRKEYDASLKYYGQSLDWYKLLNDKEGIAFSYNNIGLSYLDKKEYKLAGEYFFKALSLAREVKLYEFTGDIYSNLKFYYEELGDYKNALYYYDQYNTVYDSLLGEKKNKQIRQLQAKYDLEKKQNQILVLEQENIRQQSAISNARLVQLLLATFALAAIAAILFILRMWKKEKKLRRELHENGEMLKKLNASKDKFFSIIAHDLRNPFHALFSYTSMLKKGLDDFTKEEVNDILKDLHVATDQGYNLLQNLLFWTRSQSDRLYVFRTNFDLAKVVEEVIRLATPNANKKKQNLVFQQRANCMVHADKDMISTIVRNLVFNAIKFSGHGAVVELELHCENGNSCLKVIDHGVGISRGQLEKLFVIEEHVSTIGTDGEMGSGLGLILCQEFAEKNGGHISVDSVVGQGSVFTFRLPCN